MLGCVTHHRPHQGSRQTTKAPQPLHHADMPPALPADSSLLAIMTNGPPPLPPSVHTGFWPLNRATSRLELQHDPLLVPRPCSVCTGIPTLSEAHRPLQSAAAYSAFHSRPSLPPLLLPCKYTGPFLLYFYWPDVCLACFGHDRTSPPRLSLSPISGDPRALSGPYTHSHRRGCMGDGAI